MSSIGPNTPKIESAIPITPGKRTKKGKIAESKPQVQATASNINKVQEEQIQTHAAEIEKLKAELSKTNEKYTSLKEKFSALIKKTQPDAKTSDVDSEPSETEAGTSKVDSNDVQNPTQKDLTTHLSKIRSEIDTFSALNDKIDNLRNKVQICKNELTPTSSVADYEDKLAGYDKAFHELKDLYIHQWESIEKTNTALVKLIDSARFIPLTEENKKTFSAIANYSLIKLKNEEENYNKVLNTCITVNKSIISLLENTARRFKNACDDLNYIDDYIHTTCRTDDNSLTKAFNSLKYIAGKGKTVTRVFDPKQKPVVVDNSQAETALDSKVADVNKEEAKTAEAPKEESNVIEAFK